MFNDFPEITVLTHWSHASDFKIAIFNLISLIGISGFAYDNTFRRMPRDIDSGNSLVLSGDNPLPETMCTQTMLSPYGVIRPPWVK